MIEAEQQAANDGEVQVSKRRIENLRARLEDQSLELSRLALDLNRGRLITQVIVRRISLTVQFLDLEIRELSGIEAGQLR